MIEKCFGAPLTIFNLSNNKIEKKIKFIGLFFIYLI